MVDLSEDRFDELIYDDEKTVVTLFYRQGCFACSETLKVLEASLFPASIELTQVNVDKENNLFRRFGLCGVPQVLFFQNGIHYATLSGIHTRQDYEDAVEKVLLGQPVKETGGRKILCSLSSCSLLPKAANIQ